MTEDSQSLPPWAPTRLYCEIRTSIDDFAGPPPELTEEARLRNEELLACLYARLGHVPTAATASPAAVAPVTVSTPPPSLPVSVRQVLDALDRLALRCLAASMTDPFELATALRLLDGVTSIRRARGIERRAIADIGPTTWQVAEEVFDTVHFQTLAEPAPSWAVELATSLARVKARSTLTRPLAATRDFPTSAPPSGNDETTSYLNVVRGLEVGHLEALLDADTPGGVDVEVLEGLHAAAMLRLNTGITRDQEVELRRDAAGRTSTPRGHEG